MEPTDFKNVTIENIYWAISEDTEVAEVKRPRNSKRQKFYHEKSKKLDDFEILTLVTSTSYSENFHFSNLLVALEAGC